VTRFSAFDTRHYRTVDVRTGYGEWVGTYEQTVEDAMDLAVLDRLTSVRWENVRRAVDLGCGTGRTAAWLQAHGVVAIDGVDATPEMLEVARERGLHERLVTADVSSTGLKSDAYDLAIACLVDEHLAEIEPLYREAWRLAERGGTFVLVGFHPHFIMTSGMPTHFESREGEPVAIETHVHLLSEHVTVGLSAGWTLVEMAERVVDDEWIALKPGWARYRGHPVSIGFVWRNPA
jgi:SAM-dependent methyltransferase